MNQDNGIVGQVGPYRVVRLSRIVDPATETRRCEMRRFKGETLGVVDYRTEMDLQSHLGTHVEGPYHYLDELKDTVTLSVERYIGRGVLLRLDTCQPRALITREHLDAADQGRVREGDIVVLDSPYHHEPFLASPDDERPQLSRESAEWFLEKMVKSVAFGDGVAIENNPVHCVAVHDTLMPNDITFIEVMENLDQLHEDVFMIVFLPLPIKGMDSSPVYVAAIEGIPGL